MCACICAARSRAFIWSCNQNRRPRCPVYGRGLRVCMDALVCLRTYLQLLSLSLSLSLCLSVSVSLSRARARTLTHTHTFVHAHNYYFTLPPSLALPPSLPLVFVLSCAHPHRSHTQANDQPIAAHKRKLGFIDIALSDWAGEIIFWVYVCASPQQAGQRLVSKLEDTDRRITTCLSTLFPQQTLSTRVNSF